MRLATTINVYNTRPFKSALSALSALSAVSDPIFAERRMSGNKHDYVIQKGKPILM